MANLYIWFESNEERRKFVLELLDIREILPKGKSKKAKRETERKKKELNRYLEFLEAGKTSSPWYELHKHFYMGITPDLKTEPDPWTEVAVFKKGFRRIYTQKSYFYRPGYWLVLQFRDNSAGRERRKWVEQRISEERIGLNVPIPPEGISKLKLKEVRSLLSRLDFISKHEIKLKAMNISLKLLNEVKESHPQLFRGNNVYLWEQLAFAYHHIGRMDKADYCLRTQASFQEGITDAYLNLGAFYAEYGMYDMAVKAYLEGLAINPKDEYIYHNLAALYRDIGLREIALNAINKAILENPDRGLNYKIKGDLQLEAGQYHAAITAYNHAVDIMDNDWDDIKEECYFNLALAYKALNEHEKALHSLEKAYHIDEQNVDTLLKLVYLCRNELGDLEQAKIYAEKVLALAPDCSEACSILAHYYQQNNNNDLAKWYLKRAERIKNNRPQG